MLWAILITYLVLLALVTVFQRQLLYFPVRSDMTPQQAGLRDTQDVRLPAPDGIKLQLWVHPPPPGAPMVVYFHGNGGHPGMRAPLLEAFRREGLGFAILGYRGYGASEGRPSEQANYRDAAQTLDYVTGELGVPPERVVLYGESLGTGVAVEMATRFKAGMLVLQAPYTSVRARAQELYRIFPVRWLLREPYDSLAKIGQVRAPLLVFHGEEDLIIPSRHGRTLFEAAGEPKQAVFFPDTGHEDFPVATLAQLVAEQARRHGLLSAPEEPR